MATNENFCYQDDSLYINFHRYDNCKPNEFNSHFHVGYELIFFFKIVGEYVVESRKYSLSPNNLLLIKPTKYHYIVPKANTVYERIVINIPEKTIPKTLIKKAFDKGEFFQLGENSPISNNFHKLREYGNTLTDEELNAVTKALLIEIIILVARFNVNIDTNDYTHLDQLSLKIINYINQNITNISSLEQICKDLFISKSTLYNSFQKTMKISIMKYIRNKKLLYAQQLILNGLRPTKVYAMCGFNDYITFYRNYKSYFKCSPNDTAKQSVSPQIKFFENID